MSKILIGIDIGGTNIKIGCFDNDLKLLCKTSVETKADMGPEVVVERIGRATENVLASESLNFSDISAVGIGTPGPAKYKEGIIILAANMPKFHDVNIKQMISDRLCRPAVLENDANVACWGEFVAGAGKGFENMIFFTLGTGIGGGMVIDGKLVQGCDENAAELGHLIIYPGGRKCNCGQSGCVEAYASANSTAKRAEEAIIAGEESSLKKILENNGQITCKDVYQHLEAGDRLAKRITDQTAEVLGILCVNILHTTDPNRIVFAGGMIAAGNLLLDRIKDYFNENIWTLKKEAVEICFAALGEDAGIIGAAALAKNI